MEKVPEPWEWPCRRSEVERIRRHLGRAASFTKTTSRHWQDLKDQLAFDFYEHLSSLRQETRMVLRSYTNEAVESLTGYSYLLEATSVLSS